ncbi:MAG: sialate O-acetylesterase [Phycisphaerales bacterium]
MTRTAPNVNTKLASLAVLAILAQAACADVRLPSVLGSGMVLQRETDAAIWGWADADEAIRVRASWSPDAVAEARADSKGRWRVLLRTPVAGGPHTIVIEGKNRLEIKDVLSGEVWVCSGQSNMEWPLSATADAEREIAQAKHPMIRFYDVTNTTAATPRDDTPAMRLGQEGTEAGWAACSPETAQRFSAVAYFFARELNETLGVPVGLIGANWGGTVAEAWTSAAGLAAFPEFAPDLAKVAAPDAKLGPNNPSVLYNAMIAPLTGLAIRGAIWYQGESNIGRAEQYQRLFPAMIGDWRRAFNRGDFPFFFVQIAPFAYPKDSGATAALREAQAMARATRNTGMVVTMDIGDPLDIHPRNKKTVGERLANLALYTTYGKGDVPCHGPEAVTALAEGRSLRVRFAYGDGLEARGGPALHFEVAGEDGVFVEANATIEGSDVIVSSDRVAKPVAVRYAWSAAAETNLFNKAGLPAVPFRLTVTPTR